MCFCSLQAPTGLWVVSRVCHGPSLPMALGKAEHEEKGLLCQTLSLSYHPSRVFLERNLLKLLCRSVGKKVSL